jgi:penicillin-binding protein 1A
MGVRQSKLDVVPSLALGTSPVTLKEMVAAYGTIANGGSYHRAGAGHAHRGPQRQGAGRVCPRRKPEPVLSPAAASTLRDALRGVVDKGTGGHPQPLWHQADVAGKTGTTQDNTDGWFILMHPQLVAGRVGGLQRRAHHLRSDYWGQGARSALPMVGEVFQPSWRWWPCAT